ncbi:M60 family metallopeptidase [Nonomuraea angiospora]
MPITRRTLITGLAATGATSLLSRPASAATVPARRTVVLRGRPAAEAERLRMQTVYRTTEFVPTGLYLPPGRALTLEVRANDGALPVAHVGAADTNPDTTYRYPRDHALVEGVNTITDPGGGPVYLSMVGDRRAQAVVRFGPEGVPTPTFVLAPSSGCGDPAAATSRAWQGRAGFAAPVFAAHGTAETEFQAQVDTLTDSPFVELVSPQMIVTVRRETFLQVRDQDHAELMRLLEQVEDVEAAISGFDGSSALHAPTPLGRHLINVRSEYGPKSTAYATHAYTAYYDAYTTTRLLLPDKVRTTGWGVYHELGHQHQQMAWRPSELTEVTVNIYSLAVQRHFGMPSSWAFPVPESGYAELAALGLPAPDTDLTALVER